MLAPHLNFLNCIKNILLKLICFNQILYDQKFDIDFSKYMFISNE